MTAIPAQGSPSNWRHGLQLAAAVVVSYLLSAALGLPESLWAVMSSLIVMRPTAGSTLGAGWDRMRGSLTGTLFGLGGIWLHHLGVATPVATLAIVALLALSSAWFPAMRSAPIAALIVLSSAGFAGQSALRVAGLRVAEITIGVFAGLAISLVGLRSQARLRFDAACAALLMQIAADVQRDLGAEARTPQQKEEAADALRTALRELAVLAVSADRDARLWRRRRNRPEGKECARTARLLVRISHDSALFARLMDSAPLARTDPAWCALAVAVSQALATTASSLTAQASPDLGALRRFCVQGGPDDVTHPTSPRSPIPWIAPSARLLLQDLVGLTRRTSAN